MIQRDATGVRGATTIRLGSSVLNVSGRLDRNDIRRAKEWLHGVEQYVETAGYYDCQPCQDSGSFLDDFAQGAGIVRDVANSPLGLAAASAAGPYGAAALAAANAVPVAVDMLERAGVDRQHAEQVAQMTSPDPRQRAEGQRRAQNLGMAARMGDVRAAVLQRGMQEALAVHAQNLIQELRYELQQTRTRLARYEPVAGVVGAVPMVSTTSGPAPAMPAAALLQHPELVAVLQRALSRANLNPQPSFRSRPRPTARRARA